MNKPTTGYYRTILKEKHPDVRIAISSVPMSGVTVIDNTEVLKALDESKDEYAPYYSERLRNGEFKTIIENSMVDGDRYFRAGELYFKS